MKNKYLLILLYVILNSLIFTFLKADEQFSFDVTEIEIKDNGNIINGYKRGEINTDSKIRLIADEFKYNKITNIFKAEGDVIVKDLNDNTTIYTDKITYLKNDEVINTLGQSKATKDKITIQLKYLILIVIQTF